MQEEISTSDTKQIYAYDGSRHRTCRQQRAPAGSASFRSPEIFFQRDGCFPQKLRAVVFVGEIGAIVACSSGCSSRLLVFISSKIGVPHFRPS